MKTRNTIEALYKRALKVQKVKQHRYSFDTSDFPAWYVVKLLENKSQHQTIDQAFIDYLRDIKNNPLTRLRDSKIIKSYQLEDKLIKSIDLKSKRNKIMSQIKTKKQKQLMELLLNGLSLKQASIKLNCSISSISHLKKAISRSLLLETHQASKHTPYNL